MESNLQNIVPQNIKQLDVEILQLNEVFNKTFSIIEMKFKWRSLHNPFKFLTFF